MLACPSNLISKPPLALKADNRQSRLCSIKEEVSSLAKTLLYWSRNYEDGTVDEVDLQDFRWDNIRNKFFKTLCGFVVAEPPLDAVVKVTCFSANPDFTRPWQREQECASSSRFIIPGRKVLTCAHSVDHHTQVKLKRHGSDTTYTATVLAMAPESDIALLTVKNDAFWEGVKPVDFGDLPAPKDELIIAGYPMDREQLCAIRGTMSKASVVPYYHSGTKLLALQEEILEGPFLALKANAWALHFKAQRSVGEIIPVPIIKHFLQDFDKNGADTGVPSFGINWQEMENPDLRASMKMRSDQQGVLVSEILPRYPESDMLKPYDVIFSIDGVNIANEKLLLKADINNGYDEMAVVCNQVLTLNGEPVKSLKNLAVTVENCGEGFLKFVLENGKTVVLEAKAAKAATPDILKAHCISSAMSDDLKT
ncbi:hypothetical protein RJ639_022885 [Escallonia herrerae]|uniref:Protease Do-like PDZ domain-containing protein n=1 Tax=Escallonia herrerae TaxID=1293975 RepID=A0AA89AC08_9ASTE|nr:hypothetical protein RJ639_022885 [Escallonia herrerae]